MRRILAKYHCQIDFASIYIFIYCLVSYVLICVPFFTENELIHTIFALVTPILFVKSKYIQVINILIHRIFGFRK